MLTTVISTIFVFGLLVFVHELGHFGVAKLVGMSVQEFAIGFGPKIIGFTKGETLYSWRIVPLGGFTKIAGMDPEEEQDERSFHAKPIWARMLVIVAGSLMNFVLPVVIFLLIFLTAGIDMPPEQPIVGGVLSGKPAMQAGLAAGDRILAVNQTPIESWQQFVSVIQTNSGHAMDIQFERDGAVQHVSVIPEYDAKANRGLIGITPFIPKSYPGFFEALGLSLKNTYLVLQAMIVGIYQMVTGQVPAELAGPIGVAQMAGEVAQMGMAPLLQFAAFLSINLGLINLLPVPILDGGYVVTLAVEGVRGKALSKEKTQFIQMVGFVLLLLLMVFATFKDITRNLQ